jgi:hypothetical protein
MIHQTTIPIRSLIELSKADFKFVLLNKILGLKETRIWCYEYYGKTVSVTQRPDLKFRHVIVLTNKIGMQKITDLPF